MQVAGMAKALSSGGEGGRGSKGAREFCVIPVDVSASTVCQMEILNNGTYGERHCLLARMSC
jgi:hypothetical protein